MSTPLSIRLLVAISFLLFYSPSVFAQTPCGNIITPEDPADSGSPLLVTPIQDCADPFGVTIDPPNPYNVKINGVVIAPGSEVLVTDGRTNDVDFNGSSLARIVHTTLYKHNANNYEFVSRERPEPTASQYRDFARTYFATTAEQDQYLEILNDNLVANDLEKYFYDPQTGEDIIDQVTGETVRNRYQNFVDAFYLTFDDSIPYIEAGTYTMVFTETQVEVTQRTLWDSIRDFVIPTAYAQCQVCASPNIYAITFTIAEIPPEPTGASSILFLPGIMGSKLYEESDACDDEIKEQERWFSTTDCEQLRLLTDFTGTSENDIYTKNSQSSIADEVLFQNLYKSFLIELIDWKGENLIKDFRAVPYDWRLKLDDILASVADTNTNEVRHVPGTLLHDSYLYEILEELAEDSLSGKVTIVAHSNGGLVAKSLIKELERRNDPLLARIDNLILVAVPQVGTPESLASILHGSGLGPLNKVVSQSTSRRLSNTAPFSHHLLPNQSYFDLVQTPVLAFEEGSATGAWRTQFGAEVADTNVMHSFLSKDSGRGMPQWDELLQPATVDNFLLNYANITEQKFRAWTPPMSINVYQIAGTGLPTQTGITYFTDRECIKRSLVTLYVCGEYRDKLGYRINDAIDGDETVAAPSALAMSAAPENIENWWLDLSSYNKAGFGGSENSNRRHKDIFEVEEIIDFVYDITINKTKASYEYLFDVAPNYENEKRLIFTLHSPLDLALITKEGEVSSTSDDVAGAVYKRYGELQYISIPANILGDKTLLLSGEATGSFTLEVDEQEGAELKSRQTFSAVPSSTSTKATLELKDTISVDKLVIQVDYDGNGEVDVKYNTEGVVVQEPLVLTYHDLNSALETLKIRSAIKKSLIKTSKTAEHFSKKALGKHYQLNKKKEIITLEILKKQIILYQILGIISREQRDKLIEIVDFLIDKV